MRETGGRSDRGNELYSVACILRALKKKKKNKHYLRAIYSARVLEKRENMAPSIRNRKKLEAGFLAPMFTYGNSGKHNPV